MNRNIIALFLLLLVVTYPNPNITNAQTHFPDVTQRDHWWAKDSIDFMLQKGVVAGYPDGTFKPDQAVTYAELSTIIWNLFDKEGLSPFLGDEPFINLPVNRWDAYNFFFTTFYFINPTQYEYEYEGEGVEVLHTIQNLKDVRLVYYSYKEEYMKSSYVCFAIKPPRHLSIFKSRKRGYAFPF